MRHGFSLVELRDVPAKCLLHLTWNDRWRDAHDVSFNVPFACLLHAQWNDRWRDAHGCARPACRASSGFSLVELSIVLVILGLLTGGILTGQNLIRAAELRAVATEFQRYQASVYTFRDKYFALPGDMPNAESFWGTMSSGTCPAATGGVGTETCNGNGDGVINSASAALRGGERYMFWQHLANAGMIEGTYTGIAGPGQASDVTIGENVPASRIGSSGWSVVNHGNLTAPSATRFAGKYGNLIVFGTATDNDITDNPALTPTEMWGIDKKMDDGLPAQGKLLSFNATFRPDCVDSDDAATAVYLLDTDAVGCSIIMRGL